MSTVTTLFETRNQHYPNKILCPPYHNVRLAAVSTAWKVGRSGITVGIGATDVVVVHDEVGSCEGTALVTVSVRVCVTVTVFLSASSIILAILICFEVGDNDASSTKPCVANATGPGTGRIYRLSAASTMMVTSMVST